MTIPARQILELAERYALATEIVCALRTGALPAADGDAADDWTHRWLELSDWARHRELRDMNRQLDESLAELRAAVSDAEASVAKALQRCRESEAYVRSLLVESTTPNTRELAYRLERTRAVRDTAVSELRSHADASVDYATADAAVVLARLRARKALAHCEELRRARTRAAARGFFLSLVAMVTLAYWLHWWLGPR